MRIRALTAGAILAAIAATGVLSGCSGSADNTPLKGSRANQLVRQIADAADSKQVVGVRLSSFEAQVQVARGQQVETWTLREGAKEPVRAGVGPLEPAARPIPANKVDVSGPARALTDSDINVGCSPRGVRLDIDLQLGRPLTHLVCLDNSRHIWLGADLRPLTDVDLRSAEGIGTALSDLRAVTAGGPIGHLALRYDENTRLDWERPGTCGDLVHCPATLVSRIALFTSAVPVMARQAPARLNYAVPMDPATLDPVQLHASIKQVMTDRRYNWWRQFTVTIYQVQEDSPVMEFKVGTEVFYTDLTGKPLPTGRP
ncbi:hypothetical protein HJ590_03385 [Naumannella sp. ID2617S]|nr:hypothetical protein [Naumannella sp. ID2617S]